MFIGYKDYAHVMKLWGRLASTVTGEIYCKDFEKLKIYGLSDLYYHGLEINSNCCDSIFRKQAKNLTFCQC